MGDKRFIGGQEAVWLNTPHDRAHPYTVIDNVTLQDNRLSDRAFRLLMRILTLPKDWKFTQTGLASVFGISRPTVVRALEELDKYGYVRISGVERMDDGKFSAGIYTITQRPDLSGIMLEPEYELNRVSDLTHGSGKQVNRVSDVNMVKNNAGKEENALNKGFSESSQNIHRVSDLPHGKTEHNKISNIQNKYNNKIRSNEPVITSETPPAFPNIDMEGEGFYHPKYGGWFESEEELNQFESDLAEQEKLYGELF